MKTKRGKPGITLTEMTIVIMIASIFALLGVPAIRTLFDSMASGASAKTMISAALASARAIAAKKQRYAGVRFQKAYDPQNPLENSQYMIFILQDPALGTYSFRTVKGLEPIKLPENIGLMDRIVVDRSYDPAMPGFFKSDIDILIDNDALINTDERVIDTTSFSIIFSPSGKLVIHDVEIRNRDGVYRPDNDTPTKISMDDIFNSPVNILNKSIGMFVQDDYGNTVSLPYFGLGRESSRSSFIIYERDKFKQAYDKRLAYSAYLIRLIPEAIYINPYTGKIIN